jgi:hypothetical protein
MKEFVRLHKRAVLLGLAAALLVAASIGGTLAWLTSAPSGLTNTFVPGKVPNEITETFDGSTKSNVRIKNVGNVNAFIRVALVSSWRNNDADHTGTGLSATGTYDITINTTDWTLGSDGYYYYNSAVQPDGSTAVLVISCSPKTGLSDSYLGKVFELDVISQSIQAEGMGQTIDTAQEAFQIALNASASNPGV